MQRRSVPSLLVLVLVSGTLALADAPPARASDDAEALSARAASCTTFLQRHPRLGKVGLGFFAKIRRTCLTTIAEVYMRRGFLAHGTPPDYNTPEELTANIEAVKAVLADDATRFENGFDTGVGEAIAETFRLPVFKVIAGVEDIRWTVDLQRDEAFAAFDLPTIRSASPTLIGERFKIENGLIAEIEAFFSIPSDSLPVCEVVEEIPCS